MPSSIESIRLVAERLGSLLDRVVFLGGAVVGLLVTDSAAGSPRLTVDVDIVIEMTSAEYLTEDVRRTLIAQGFREASGEEEGSIVRWRLGDVHVDICPVSPSIFGFSNRWYPAAFKEARHFQLANGPSIQLISAPYFLATKLEAFASRGLDDYVEKSDMEDIVAVIDGRPSIVDDVRAASPEVRAYLAVEFARLLAIPAFQDALPGHLMGDAASQARLPILLSRLREICRIS
jgi:hypothetical protein